MKELNSEELRIFHERVDTLKCMIENRLRPLIANAALQVAKAAYGGSVGLIQHLLERHANSRRELTPEQIAEFELMEKEEIECSLRDYTPNLENPMYDDEVWLAQWLLAEASSGGDFDEVFEQIMVHRYDKTIMTTINGKTEVWRRVRTLEEHEEILI